MPDGNQEIPKIRTMRSDADELAKEKNMSRLDIAAKSYATREKGERVLINPKLNLSFTKIFAGFMLLIILGAGGYFGYGYFTRRSENVEAVVSKTPAKLLAVDDEKKLTAREATPGSLIAALNAERQKPLKFGTIIYFPIEIFKKSGETKFAEAGDFIGALSWKPPATFSQNILPDFNALAVYNQSSNDLAVIFRVSNLDRVLGSFLEWERVMPSDLKPFMNAESATNLSQFKWQDEIVRNNDARVFKNSAGKVILAHAIFNKQLAIISTSRDGLATIIERLTKLPTR